MLTLKVLKRKLTARSVAEKFMGHGQCDAFSRFVCTCIYAYKKHLLDVL
jgi:hypothetical protein